MTNTRIYLLCAMVILALVGVMAQQAPPAGDFRLQDFLGKAWQNERVSFPLTEAQFRHAQAGHALLGADDKPVLYQLIPNTTLQGARVAFLANLASFETRVYRFSDAPATVTGDLKVEEDADTVTLTNSKTGIRLPKALKTGAGPIGGVRLLSGKWVGGSRLTSDPAVTAYTVEILSRGPVSAEALCKATFADNSTWQMRVRLDANEPVVLVDETSAVEGKAAITLNLSQNFTPDTLLYRWGKQVPAASIGKNGIWKIEKGDVYVLAPWLHWWERERQGNCMSLYREDGTDLLTMAAREAGVWVDPKIEWKKQADIRLFVKQDDQGLHVDLPLKTGQRKWLLAALDKDASLVEAKDEKKAYHSPLPYQYLIKHGHFPLDVVKDYTLVWKRDGESYPHMLVTKKDVERFKKSVTDPAPYEKAIPGYLRDPNPLNQFTMEGPIKAYFATGNADLGKYLATSLQRMMQEAVEFYTRQNGIPLGCAPHHHQQVGSSMLLADTVLAADYLTPEEKERLLAQAAFIGYVMCSPNYWSGERGYAANPNMTTSVLGYQSAIACLVPNHPLAKEWIKQSMTELKGQLDYWSDENGGWLEAPHYAMVSYDQILSSFVMAHNAGFNDFLYDPKIKTVINWFSKISTPPDSRLGGFRHLPPAGNTYLQEACGEFGIVAFLFKDKDPAFAAQMQWMFKQQRSWPYPGVGGGYPAFAGYRSLMFDPALAEKAPPWKSELFSKTAVVLRNAYPSDRETYLHMIQGDHRAHFDDDSGSVILWGKGRIIADDFGYYIPEGFNHNQVQAAVANGTMYVKDFYPGKNLDYVSGVKDGWTRQIAFVKEANPLGANYFVFNDSFRSPVPATWRLHVVGNKVTLANQRATVDGKEDVDTDLFFLQPAPVKLTTEEKTKTANSGIFPDGRSGAVPMTQICIAASAPNRFRNVTAVIYPRLKLEMPPVVTPLEDGKALKIEHASGVDYVFLSQAPFEYEDADITFSGMSAVLQIRNGKPIVSFGTGGTLTYKGKTFKDSRPLPKISNNLVPDGDFETGAQKAINPDSGKYGVKAELYKGNPAVEDPEHQGKYCVALKVAGKGGVTGSAGRIVIDPTKTYRISMNYFTPDAMSASIAGYGWDSKGAQMPNWQWNLGAPKGQMTAWQMLETTVGPKKSTAAQKWPDDILSTNIGMWLGGTGTIYIDDVVIEEVEEQ
ncbi:MAG: hypothetical protein ACYDBB_17925 [Armatimonadota bacterium]